MGLSNIVMVLGVACVAYVMSASLNERSRAEEVADTLTSQLKAAAAFHNNREKRSSYGYPSNAFKSFSYARQDYPGYSHRSVYNYYPRYQHSFGYGDYNRGYGYGSYGGYDHGYGHSSC